VSWFPHEQLQRFISAYGYWAVALIVGLESMGLPLPGESVLVLATIYAATDPSLNVWFVIAAAAPGSIIGDNVGYWLGKKYGYALLRRYGRHIGMSGRRGHLGHGIRTRRLSLRQSAPAIAWRGGTDRVRTRDIGTFWRRFPDETLRGSPLASC
jgi:membrane protein YqaA with SNARE-associated domain